MRFRSEFLFASAFVVLCYSVIWHAARAGDCTGTPGMLCQGNVNCMTAPCITQPPEGYSCAMVEPIDHPECVYTGNLSDCCEEGQVPCAKLVFYAGGPCVGDPPECSGEPLGETEREEDGC